MRSAKLRRRTEILEKRRKMEIAAPRRKFQRINQYPPSKYASDLTRCSAGTVASHASVAAAGSTDLFSKCATEEPVLSFC